MNSKLNEVPLTGKKVIDEVERAFVGKRDLLETIMAAVLAGGHLRYPRHGETGSPNVVGKGFERWRQQRAK